MSSVRHRTIKHFPGIRLSRLHASSEAFRYRTSRAAILQEISHELNTPLHRIDCSLSFIQNGGDSFSAIKLASSCRSKGLNITASMIMGTKSLNLLVKDIERIDMKRQRDYGANRITKGRKQFTRHRKSTLPSPPSLPENSSNTADCCEATDMQLSFLHGSKSYAGRNVILYYETYRMEDIPKVKDAWRTLISTEPIFQTQFQQIDDKYWLVEGDGGKFIWDEMTVHDKETYKTQLENDRLSTDFTGVAFKTVHLDSENEPRESTVVWIVHHALIDGFSSVLLLNKHRRLLSGELVWPAPSFVQLIREISLAREIWKPTGQEFWVKQQQRLQAARSELLLPSPSIPFTPSYVCKQVTLGLPPNTMNEHATRTGVTVASIFYAAWALTLSQFVDSRDVYFGVVLSGRSLPLPGAQTVIGPLINTVPFQVATEPTLLTSEFLGSVFKHSIDLDRHQWTMPTHGVTKNFSSVLNIHFETPLLQQSPLELLQKPRSNVISALPLNVDIQLDGTIQIFYHKHKFFESDIARMGRYFTTAVEKLLSDQLTLQECSHALLLEDLEIIRAYSNMKSVSTTLPAWNQTLVELFDTIAEANPGFMSVEKDGTAITYSELQTMATIVARQLARQISVGDVICVHADRTINWIIAIYGILKAGGVYCPLDEALPNELRAQNFATSGSRIFLTGATSDITFTPTACASSMSVEELLKTHEESPIIWDSLPDVSPDGPAYLCFSSGSTGMPKGILCSHNSLVAFQSDFNVRLMAKPGWRIAQVMSPAFDGSIHEIFSALSYGATLVLKGSADPLAHLFSVDAAILTPSIAKILDPNDFPLKFLYLVGEAVPQDVCDKWASMLTVYNMYGPTEATCGATIKLLEPRKGVTLGKPNPTTRLYILNSNGQLVPPGVIGELYLAGVQVSQGYVRRPEETTKRFLQDTISPGLGERMYRTGDRGYWDCNGELLFCGRQDRQIKLRGFRIDLDDIEARIRNAVPECTAAAVACENEALIALLQPAHLRVNKIKERLSQTMPSYAIPRHILPVSKFPQTNAGKLDYKHIKEIVQAGQAADEAKPCNELFTLVSKAWKETLGLPENSPLDKDSNFFELGGHSLLQLQLANRLSALLGLTVPLISVVRSCTIGDLAASLVELQKFDDSNVHDCHKSCSVSPIEEDWWRKYQYHGGSSAFNVTALFRLGNDLDILRLREAWNDMLGCRSIFRSRYDQTESGSVQRTYSEKPPSVVEVREIDVEKEVNRPFDLRHDNLIRVLLSRDKLLMVASHIICDYTSLNMMLQEVSGHYHGMTPQKPRQYEDYISLQTAPTQQQLSFWHENFKDIQDAKYSIGNWTERNRYSGSSRLCRISTETFRKLRQFALSQKVTAHQISLAAVAVALQHKCKNIDIILGAPHLGRTSSNTENIVGLFLEPLPIRIRYPINIPSVEQTNFPHSVRKISQNALCHAIPWNSLLDSLNIAVNLPDNPLFDVMVSYHDSIGKMGMSGIDAKPAYTWTDGAKFKLMVEFLVANKDSLIMRLEYSDECFDEGAISTVQKLTVAALEMIVDGTPFDSMVKSLQTMSDDSLSHGQVYESQNFFGTCFENM